MEFQLQHQSFQCILRVGFLRIDWFDLLAVQGTLKSLLQHHSSKGSVLQCSTLFIMVQLLHLYMTTGKTTVLTRWTLVGKVISLLFNMLSRFVIALLPRSKCLLISWHIIVHSDFGAQENSLSLFPLFRVHVTLYLIFLFYSIYLFVYLWANTLLYLDYYSFVSLEIT